MRAKIITVMVLALLCTLLVSGGKAVAGTRWWMCTIVGAEIDYNGAGKLRLIREGANNPRPFTIPSGQENRMLAIALTAMSSGMSVEALFDWVVPDSEIETIRLLYTSP